ncbi:MAG: tetratricopeptide repeat protein, partial [bacterium]
VLLARARDRGAFIAFERMEPSLIYLDTPEEVQLAYAEAASAADFITRRLGQGGLGRLLRAIARAGAKRGDGAKREPKEAKAGEGEKPKAAAGPEAAAKKRAPSGKESLVELEGSGPAQSAEPGLRSLLGVDLAGFQKLWREDLKRLTLRVRPGARVRRHRLKPKGPLDEDVIDLAVLKSAVARRRMRLADRISMRGRLRAAWVEYRRALRDEPHSLSLLNRLARIEIRLGALEKARAHIREALEIDPDSGVSYIHLGLVSEMSKDARAARAAWEQAIQINPFDPLPHARLGSLYAAAGEKEKAEREKAALHALRDR